MKKIMKIFNIAPQIEQAFFCVIYLAIATVFIPASKSMVTLFFQDVSFQQPRNLIGDIQANVFLDPKDAIFPPLKLALKYSYFFNRVKEPPFLCSLVFVPTLYMTFAVLHFERVYTFHLTQMYFVQSTQQGTLLVDA